MSKKKSNGKYTPVLDGIPRWPVYQLSKNKKAFLEDVKSESIKRIKLLRNSKKQLFEEIETTIYREQNRIKKNQWKVDPPHEKAFWSNLKGDLEKCIKEQDDNIADKIIEAIVNEYANEIVGNFRPSYYKLTREVVKFCFSRLLNGTQIKKFGSFFRSEYALRDKISIIGEVEMLRKLATQGTLVMVPTHFSNLDSILVGWVIHCLGLPAFIYGAGLNLFNIKILAYFMNSLGAYKVDRRKKNLFYLETLKIYSALALERGAHSLFFPGGTRSRSGSIETQLKLGLLSTSVEAQRSILMRSEQMNIKAQKIFVVPVTLNYRFVLEAPELIENHLYMKGKEHQFAEDEKHGSFHLLKYITKFFTKGSNISISVGSALDVVGNYVDMEGNSLDKKGNLIDIKSYFMSDKKICIDRQRENEYTRILSKRIVKEYYRIAEVSPSHLVAFIAFELWQKKYDKLELTALLCMPEEELFIDYTAFKKSFEKVRKQLYKLEQEDKVRCSPHLNNDLDYTIRKGLKNVGIFHVKRPLLINKKGNIVTQDITTLYYYHNRLNNYNLEAFV